MNDPSDKRSLKDIYPTHREVPVLLSIAFLALLTGLSVPLITVEKSVLWRHWENHYSVFVGVTELAKHGDVILAAVVFFFSMIFPFAKLYALWTLWEVKFTDEQREKLLYWLGMLGKWSMLDVFAVAILVVAAKLRSLTQVEPRAGVYFFGFSILLSMISAMYIDRLARKAKFS